jgi:predicted MPP superfamily phosphohydrolase
VSHSQHPSEERDVLTEGRLHKLMVFFNQPVHWPAWRVVLLLALMAALVGGWWWLLGAPLPVALGAGGLLLLFFLADLVAFWLLPRLRISFGPWQAQTVVLAVPRLAAGVALPLVALLLGWQGPLWLMAGVQLLGTLLLIWGAFIEVRRLSLSQLAVHVPGLAADARPIRLLHISDIHLERLSGREERLLALAEAAQPDLIVITGDYLNLSYNEDPTSYKQVRDLLRRLHAPYGVYATLGSPPVDLRERIVPLLQELPLCLLRDEWVEVALDDGRRLALLGMDCSHNLQKDGARLEALADAGPDGAPHVLLYHSPELMPQAAQKGLDLYLCGHTHGGQVRLPLIGALLTSSQLGRRYVMGRYTENGTTLYISRGVGLEGLSAPRVRFLCPPEMTLVTLEPAL